MNGNASESEVHPVQQPDKPSVMPEVLPNGIDLEKHHLGIALLKGSLQPGKRFGTLIQPVTDQRDIVLRYETFTRQLQELAQRLARLSHFAQFRLCVCLERKGMCIVRTES